MVGSDTVHRRNLLQPQHENRQHQSLQAHIDFNYHPSEGWHRRLNLIVYLNREWDEHWGGNLELYANPYKDKRPEVAVAPLFNRCVIFGTSEKSWHGFDRIDFPPEKKHASRWPAKAPRSIVRSSSVWAIR